MNTQERLTAITNLIERGLDAHALHRALSLIGLQVEEEELDEFRLWNDYMPIADEHPYTRIQRNLHILWECLDRTPYGIHCAFAIPLRAAIAKHLFARCGEGFVAHENCRFNYGHQIEVGNNVSWNMGCYIDAKGGVIMDDYAMLTENVRIFTHNHSEGNHLERTYKQVHLKSFSKLYTGCTILPGITVGYGAIVATCAVVTKDVEDYTLVTGIPAKPQRRRMVESTEPADYNQYMMGHKEFQV